MSTCEKCRSWGSGEDRGTYPTGVLWRECTHAQAAASMWESSKTRKDFGCIFFKKADDWADRAAAEWFGPHDAMQNAKNLAAVIRKYERSRTDEKLHEADS